MLDSYYIGAYWGSKFEPPEILSEKINKTLNMLSINNTEFENWYLLGKNRNDSLKVNVKNNGGILDKIIFKQSQIEKCNSSANSQMGVVLGFWTGQSDSNSSSIMFNVGGNYSTTKLGNSCVLKLPSKMRANNKLIEIENSKALIQLIVDIWNPDYAVLTSHDLRDKLNFGNKIGWITYYKSSNLKIRNISFLILNPILNGYIFYFEGNHYLNIDSIPIYLELKEKLKYL